MSDYEIHDVIILTAPPVEAADVEQEVALLELQGKKANRAILRKKLQHYEAPLFDFTSDLPNASPMDWADTPTASFETIQAITDWALNQSAVIQDMIFSFLEDPSDDCLQDVLDQLFKAGLATPQVQTHLKEKSLTTAVIDFIGSDTRTIEDLYELGRSFLCSRRPEAAVRQTVRRLIKAGKIEETHNVYRLS